MKKLLFSILVVGAFLMSSCQKDEEVDVPGNIPGMGDNTAALEVKPVSLPANVAVVGEIKGYEGDSNKSSSLFPNFKLFGSGCNYVTLEYTLRNDNRYPVTVFIPAGTIFRSNNASFQHGILLQWVWVCIPANSQRTIVLYLYCLNWGKDYSSSSCTYEMVGQTLSAPIQSLLDMLKFKKINFEFYKGSKSNQLSDLTNALQEAIWGLTNHGRQVSNEHKEFFRGLPELDRKKIPEKMYNSSAALPVYFDEYDEED
jgi:hypothetical protein